VENSKKEKMEYRHPNIEEIIKVLKHLNENRMLNNKSIKEVLKIYEDWEKQCIQEINKKNDNKLINQFKDSLKDVKSGRINKKNENRKT
jgi:hypothetical protein